MATTTSLPLLYFLLYTLLPASSALGVPVMIIAVKRYTTVQARSFAFGLFYTVMNVAALINGVAVDALRVWLCHGLNIKRLPGGQWLADGNRLVVASGAITAAVAFIVSLCMSSSVEKDVLERTAGSGGSGGAAAAAHWVGAYGGEEGGDQLELMHSAERWTQRRSHHAHTGLQAECALQHRRGLGAQHPACMTQRCLAAMHVGLHDTTQPRCHGPAHRCCEASGVRQRERGSASEAAVQGARERGPDVRAVARARVRRGAQRVQPRA